MVNKVYILAFAIIGFSIPICVEAQVEDDFWDEIEYLIENEDLEVDYYDILEQYSLGSFKKINLNSADKNELLRIPYLSPVQVQALINHRELFGDFVSIYELQVIDELDIETIIKLKNDIEIRNSQFSFLNEKSGIERAVNNELSFLYHEKIDKSRGYKIENGGDASKFSGSPQRYVLRYRGDYKNKIFWGFTGEKDAGETFFRKDNKYGFDYNSPYLFYNNPDKPIKNIALGDFQVAFGQGLTFGSGLSLGKSTIITNVKRNHDGLRPYRSLNENDFLRGAGITFGKRNITTTLFYSKNKIDASLNVDDSSSNYIISSITSTGLHRTESEIARKNMAERTVLGANVTGYFENLSVGYTIVNTRFDSYFLPSARLYNKFSFQGNDIINQGVNYNYLLSNVLLFGEFSINNDFQSLSFVQGALLGLSKNLDFSVLHRNVSNKYQYVYSNVFSESSNISGERGTYIGFVLRPASKFEISSYFDIFKYDWLKFRVDALSSGNDFLVNLKYTQRKKFTFDLRFRNKNKPYNLSNNDEYVLNVPIQTVKNQLRFNSEYIINPELRIKTRVEWNSFQSDSRNDNKNYGSMAYVDIQKRIDFFKSKVSFRYSLFNIESYDNRIYSFENDVLYSFLIPAVYNKGMRFYIVSKTRISRRIDLWIKFSRTVYSNVDFIGSGYDRIEGNQLNEIKFQLRYKF